MFQPTTNKDELTEHPHENLAVLVLLILSWLLTSR